MHMLDIQMCRNKQIYNVDDYYHAANIDSYWLIFTKIEIAQGKK